MPARFFRSAAAFHTWMAKNHKTQSELLVGFFKKGSGKASLTYQEALDEALVIGWIDGIRRSVDAVAYTIRFTPRRPRSIWSAVNIRRVDELSAEGRMRPAGLEAYAKRDPKRSAIYSYERASSREKGLDSEATAAIKADPKAWAFFDAQAPWYKRTSAHWVTSAKRLETRAKRLATLVDCSRQGKRIPPLSY